MLTVREFLKIKLQAGEEALWVMRSPYKVDVLNLDPSTYVRNQRAGTTLVALSLGYGWGKEDPGLISHSSGNGELWAR